MNQRLSTLGVFAAVTLLLSGCAAASGSTTPGSVGGGAPAPAGSARPVPATYGAVVGSGTKVTVADGTYETISLDPKSRLYELAVGGGLAEDLKKSGFTLEDGKAAQKTALDYMAKEFFDSTALETKDQGFNAWFSTNGKTYFSDEVQREVAADPNGGQIVLGDLGSTNTMPALIHDGKPREKNVNITVGGVGTMDAQGVKGIQVELTYTEQYRLSDAAAAAFAGSLATPAMTGAQFLASSYAKDSVKDGKGENVYGVTGSATVIVYKDSPDHWKINGFKSKTDYDVSDFVTAAGIGKTPVK